MPGPLAFEASTPAEAQTNPWRVSAITSGGRERTTGARLAQDPLDVTRVAVGAGELDRARGRLDVVERDDAALDLRDGLLRDDDDVARREPTRTPLPRLVQQPSARSSPCSSSGRSRRARSRGPRRRGASGSTARAPRTGRRRIASVQAR